MISRILSLVLVAVALFNYTVITARASPTRESRQLDVAPDDTMFLAADAGTGAVYAFNEDGESLGVIGNDTSSLSKRAGGCTAMDAKTAQSIPGWKEVATVADRKWGTGSRTIVTNEKEYPQYPATICISTKPVDIAVNGKPKCSTNTQTVDGTFTGTSGSVELSVTTGTDYSVSTTTTEQTTFGIGVTYSAKFSIPEVAEIGGATTISTQIANSHGETTSGTSKHQVTTKVAANHADGKTCKLDLNTKTCTTEGSAQVPFVAKGYVWFEYADKIDGHYWWAVKIESVLYDDEDRSLYMKVDSVIGSETKSAYKAVCE
ncbi:hypothetical protein K525DRAFT_197349 [Schizophyllum commune Loenen D]|nr:hypothetical protein K525DRAFT_197349 [Schizophyllum commune Loenen D]